MVTGDTKKKTQLEEEFESYRKSTSTNPVRENAGGFCYVFGDGDVDSKVILIGEAPGKDEVKEGRPFVGKAGGILADFLKGAGIKRSELYITNTIKYRLAREGKRAGTLANRPSTAPEIAIGAKLLSTEIDIISPKVVVTLGNVPLKAMLEALQIASAEDRKMLEEGVGVCHGKAFGLKTKGGKPVILYPMYHPASLIYNHTLGPVYEADLDNLKSIIL